MIFQIFLYDWYNSKGERVEIVIVYRKCALNLWSLVFINTLLSKISHNRHFIITDIVINLLKYNLWIMYTLNYVRFQGILIYDFHNLYYNFTVIIECEYKSLCYLAIQVIRILLYYTKLDINNLPTNTGIGT